MDIFRLSEKIRFLPVVHGSAHFTRIVRERILSSPCDCLAVALPPEFQPTVEDGVNRLPLVSLSCQEEPDGTTNYVPIDPCQPVIMGLRIALQEGLPRRFIDWSCTRYEPRKVDFPDTFVLRHMAYEKFCATLLLTLKRPATDTLHDKRARWMAYQLHQLEMEFNRIIVTCSILDWPWIKEAYDERLGYPRSESPAEIPQLFGVKKETLFFALTEFPYITYLYEKNRQEMKSDREVSIDGIKEILLHARELFTEKHKVRYHNLTSQTFQIYLQYARNLTLLEDRLTPDLYTLVTTAKQFGGDPFALAVLEAAREYPFQNIDKTSLEPLTLGIDRAVMDDENTPVDMKNRLSEIQFEWRTIDLKPEADIQKREEWKYNWNPYGQCSWPPEDDQIESFNTHVREQTKLLLSNDLARTEKFTASVKDGIDMRDTLRHWHEGDLYVKEIPPSRGRVEIVVFLFDTEPSPDHYQWRQTWYAEHEEESTLCFFATDYSQDMIGPGVGRATYGGCMMIFPPRPIPDIWEDPRIFIAKTLEEKILEAAFFHSKEKHVTVVSPCLPQMSWRRLARKYHKHIIHIPLKRFSNQTIEKIRRFHVLNGKHIRTFARHFIQDL
ncbi:hypothetical protein UZ36_00280 [Candidatus Nitromaritima sp. SCGC AAA799-C22]|nr:hypothetical protein UZ36_00280 [Candidatus Nitromaritima sp. SCGC AAA799-C22]